jgi:hypothetical protein
MREVREPDGGVGVGGDRFESVLGIDHTRTGHLGEGVSRAVHEEIRGDRLDRSGEDRACLGRDYY